MVASWIRIDRATACRICPCPAMPTTPAWAIGSAAGTSGAVQCIGPSCCSRRGSFTTTALGMSAAPIRTSSQSGSFGRRSHSRARGPFANSSSVAGSGMSARRASRSCSRLSNASCSTRRSRSWYSANCSMYCFFCVRRELVKLAIIISGDIPANISVYVDLVIMYIAPLISSGATTTRIGIGIFCGRCGTFGSENSVLRSGGSSRGGRLKSIVAPSALGTSTASGCVTGVSSNSW
jgi:hypothetical protein